MGYPHHLQNPMHGGPSLDPKYPSNTDDYPHHNLYLNGYSHNGDSISTNMPSIQSSNDYVNGLSHHHHHYHHHQQSLPSGIHPNNSNSYNYSHHSTNSGHFYQHNSYNAQTHHVPTPLANDQTSTNTTYASTNNNGYNSDYYGGTNNNQLVDIPLQYSSVEPTNTMLGLQELGVFAKFQI